jgi:hypothetical protein
MGILVEFQEEKAKLLDSSAATTNTTELTNAVENFTFAQLPPRNRIALILAGVYGGEAEAYLEKIDEFAEYAQSDFKIPYRAKQ